MKTKIQKEPVHGNRDATAQPATPGPVADAFASRLDTLNIDLTFCRALVDILCFEKESSATEESFSNIKFKLWELVGEAATEAEDLSKELRDVVAEAIGVQS